MALRRPAATVSARVSSAASVAAGHAGQFIALRVQHDQGRIAAHPEAFAPGLRTFLIAIQVNRHEFAGQRDEGRVLNRPALSWLHGGHQTAPQYSSTGLPLSAASAKASSTSPWRQAMADAARARAPRRSWRWTPGPGCRRSAPKPAATRKARRASAASRRGQAIVGMAGECADSVCLYRPCSGHDTRCPQAAARTICWYTSPLNSPTSPSSSKP